jgi:ribosome-binding protein aMBF1 (putative translation factor)
MARTGRPKKQHIDPDNQLHAARAADRRAILVARRKAKRTDEFINADESEKNAILKRVRERVLHERENLGLSGKYRM